MARRRRREGEQERPSFGPHRTSGVLERGGMGVIYRGAHHATGELVSIKAVQVGVAGNLAAIRREILALRRVRHPGIVRIVTAGVTYGLPW